MVNFHLDRPLNQIFCAAAQALTRDVSRAGLQGQDQQEG